MEILDIIFETPAEWWGKIKENAVVLIMATAIITAGMVVVEISPMIHVGQMVINVLEPLYKYF